MKQYFFILGNNPSLSVAEILAWFKRKDIKYSNPITDRDFFVCNIDVDLPKDLLNQLGGVIKFGEVVNKFNDMSQITSEWLVDNILDIVNTNVVSKKKGRENVETQDLASYETISNKFYFGFSIYPKDKEMSYALRGIGLAAKKHLKEYKISSRMVMGKFDNLSSVIVQKNKLVTDRGWELIVLKINNKLLIGRTIGVQPFEALGKRDFGRPDRDDYSGMIPPKLAQAMVNLAGQPVDARLIDAFCGSGTIVQEALLLGYKNISGFDASKKAVDDSKENTRWLANEFNIDISGVNFQKIDVRELKQNIKDNSVDAVISEPYLGPPARKGRTGDDIRKIVKELTDLYTNAFFNFKSVVKSGGVIVMIFPVFVDGRNSIFMPFDRIVNLNDFTKILPIPKEFQDTYRLSDRNTLIYGRSYQKVQREIVILKKR